MVPYPHYLGGARDSELLSCVADSRDDEAVDEVELVHARQVERGQQVEVEDLG